MPSDCEIEEFRLSEDPKDFEEFEQLSLSELQLGRKSGAMILAIRNGANLITNPSGNVELAPDQLLIALGSKPELEHLRVLLGKTLNRVEKMSC